MKSVIVVFAIIFLPVISIVAACLAIAFLAAMCGAILMPQTTAEVLDGIDFTLEDQL